MTTIIFSLISQQYRIGDPHPADDFEMDSVVPGEEIVHNYDIVFFLVFCKCYEGEN